MRVYFADTIQRELLGHNQKLNIRNHLESYFFMIHRKENLLRWWLIKEKEKENVSTDK